MGHSADLEIHDKDGRPLLLVEVKGKLGTTSDWAAAMRRNLAAHGILPPAKFFLLAMPDRFYVWIDKTQRVDALEPDLAFDPASVLQPYLIRAEVQREDIAESSLELLVASWLGEIARGHGVERLPADAAAWLTREGFFEAVRSGRLERN